MAVKSTTAYRVCLSMLAVVLLCCNAGCERAASESLTYLITYSIKNFGPKLFEQFESRGIADYGILSELRGKLKISSLCQADGPAPAFVWPADTDDAFKNCMGRFLSEPKLTTVFSFPVNQTKSPVSVHMSVDGKTLYVIDIKNMVHVIDIESGTTKISFESPLKDSYAILGDVAGEYVFVANPTTLIRLNLATQESEGALVGILGGIFDWHRAVESNEIAVINEERIMYIGADFDRVELLSDAKSESKHIAIRPDGKYIAGVANGKLFRWFVSESPHRLEYLPGVLHLNYDNPVTSDIDADNWYDFYEMQEYAKDVHSKVRDVKGVHTPFVINPTVSDAMSNYVGGTSWNTIVGTVPDGTLEPPIIISSMRWAPYGRSDHSKPIRIDAKEVKKLWGSRTGERVALYTDTDIRVCNRPMFDDPTGEMMPVSLCKRVYKGKIGQIDVGANYVRACNWPEKNVTGEQMYGRIVEQVGSEWVWSIANPDEDSAKHALVALKEWKAAGDEIAIAGSAWRYMNTGGRSRANRKLADRDLNRLLAKEKPPAIVYRLAVRNLMSGRFEMNDAFKLVKRCMLMYPDYLDVHFDVCQRLLPEWGGQPGEVNDYLEKIAELYPEELQDQVYAITAMQILDSQLGIPLYGPEQANANLERIFRGARVLAQQAKLSRRQCECIIRIADKQKDEATAKEFAQYHLECFVIPTNDGHLWNTPRILEHLKIDNWRKTDRLKSESAKK